MEETLQIRSFNSKILRNLSSCRDVSLQTYNSSYHNRILGGDVISYSFIDNRPLPINENKKCHLCKSIMDDYYQWRIYWNNESRAMDLDLCSDCNSPKEIWNYIFNHRSWVSWLTNLLLPNNALTYEMFFLYLIMDTQSRPVHD